jgi:putative transposase
MKKSKFSEEQVVNILREGQSGSTIKAVCAKYNISEPTYYKWQRKYGGLEESDIRAMRALTEENARLKRIVADYAVQIDILKYVNSKKW